MGVNECLSPQGRFYTLRALLLGLVWLDAMFACITCRCNGVGADELMNGRRSQNLSLDKRSE